MFIFFSLFLILWYFLQIFISYDQSHLTAFIEVEDIAFLFFLTENGLFLITRPPVPR